MDRGAITYSLAFLAGTTAARFIPLPTWLPLVLLSICIPLILWTKKNGKCFILATHLSLAVAGAGSCTIALKNSTLPPAAIKKEFTLQMKKIQEKGAEYLMNLTPDKEKHATLCALSIGEKSGMTKELKEAFSKAGATHVLALSGLHIGIVFTLIYSILGILSIFPKGKHLRDACALAFIFAYSAATGFSPSVTRAAFMILIYRIAHNTFRNTGKWDAISLSAMVIGIIAPLQIFTVGFQLSYAAVAGIALLFPVCKEAFAVTFPVGGALKGYTRKGCEWIWDTLAISVCCQIATLPLVLYYFGNIPQYFLLSNIIAVPLATIILYNLTLTIALHGVPVIGDWSVSILNWFVGILNSSMEYISA